MPGAVPGSGCAAVGDKDPCLTFQEESISKCKILGMTE